MINALQLEGTKYRYIVHVDRSVHNHRNYSYSSSAQTGRIMFMYAPPYFPSIEIRNGTKIAKYREDIKVVHG